MSVTNGQLANQTTFNNAFVSKTANSTMSGVLGLNNADTASGDSVVNVQKELNALNSFIGNVVNGAKDVAPTWVSNNLGATGDSLQDRIEAIDTWTNLASELAADETFSGDKRFSGEVYLSIVDDAASGTINALDSSGLSTIRLTATGDLTLNGISGGLDGKLLLIHNNTGGTLTITDDSGSAASGDVILTPGGADITASDNSLVLLQYDLNTPCWRVVSGGGGGAGGAYTANTRDESAATITLTSDGLQKWKYTGSSPITLTEFVLSNLTDAESIILIGSSDTNTLSIPSTCTGVYKMNGDIELGAGNTISFMYDSGLAGLVETGRT